MQGSAMPVAWRTGRHGCRPRTFRRSGIAQPESTAIFNDDQVIENVKKAKTTLLSQTIPGLRPAGGPRPTRFAPGKSVAC